MPSVFLKLNLRSMVDRRGTKWVNLDDLLIDLGNFERDLKAGGDGYKNQSASVNTIRECLERMR